MSITISVGQPSTFSGANSSGHAGSAHNNGGNITIDEQDIDGGQQLTITLKDGQQNSDNNGNTSSSNSSGTDKMDKKSMMQLLKELLKELFSENQDDSSDNSSTSNSGSNPIKFTIGNGGAQSSNNNGASGMTGDKAISTLLNSPECWKNGSGLMDRDQLKNISENKDGHYTKDQMAAAKYLLDNPAEFNRYESRTDGKCDGKLGKGDIEKSLNDDMKRAVSDLKSARGTDGKALFSDSNPFTLGDMQRIASDTSGKYDQKTKDAAQFFVDNPGLFKKAGNAAYNDNDGKFGMTDANRITG